MQTEGPTLTILSQPQETMMGLLLLGEKRTHDTHSEWLSSWRSEEKGQVINMRDSTSQHGLCTCNMPGV